MKREELQDLNLFSVVFVGQDKGKDFEKVKSMTTGKNVLTVTERDGLGKKEVA
jgi:hypothetical protein